MASSILRLTSAAMLGAFFAMAACGSESGSAPPGNVDGDAGDEARLDATADVALPTDAGDAADAADAGDAADASAEPAVVQMIAGVVVDTFAGSALDGDAEGTGSAARFENPVGVALDGTGLVVTEYDGNRVRRIDAAGATSLAASGLAQPFGVVVAPEGIYVQTDQDENGLKGPNSGTIWRIASSGSPRVVATGLGRPRGLARTVDRRIVLSDRLRHTISLLDPTTGEVTPLAGSGVVGFADGIGSAARFDSPYGVAVLPDGAILVADSGNHCIRKVTLAGEVTVFAGDRNQGMKDNPDKMQARFNVPNDVATDASGNVYVSDLGNHRIRRIAAGGAVETVAGDGALGFVDGSGADAKFFGQEQLDVSSDGKTIYVADGSGGEPEPYHRIRRIAVP